ncbi:MAG TPA: ABC transporter substrate-binding protein, partial [Candidatus Obscuribacter sp.]|nr:ABC transporter substrate-binding protein [Candidatus Obscuribacter sp.]
RGMDASVLKQKEKEGNFTLRNLGPDDGTVFLMFNMCRRKDPKTGKFYVDPVKQDWFNSLNFRKAVSHSIDRPSIVNNILRSVGYPLYTCQTTAGVYHNTDLKPITYSLEEAKKLLKEDGFVLKGDELFDKKGNRVEFDLITNAGNTIRDAVCIHIKEQLKLLGIKVNYAPIEFNAMINRTHTTLDWQAMMLGLSGSRLEPYSGANIWKSDGRMHEFDQRLPDEKDQLKVTDARPWELELDKCLDTAAGSFDEKVRAENYKRAEAIAYEQEPLIFIYTNAVLTAARNTMGNYKPTPLAIYYTPKGSLHNLEEIYLKEGK